MRAAGGEFLHATPGPRPARVEPRPARAPAPARTPPRLRRRDHRAPGRHAVAGSEPALRRPLVPVAGISPAGALASGRNPRRGAHLADAQHHPPRHGSGRLWHETALHAAGRARLPSRQPMGSRDARCGHTCNPPRRDRDHGRATAHDRAAGEAHGGAISATRRPRHGLRHSLHGPAGLHAATWGLGRKRTCHPDHVRVMAGTTARPRISS